MRTKLSALAAAVVESGWLIALVVVPVFFNAFSSRIFEEDKVQLSLIWQSLSVARSRPCF